MPSSELGSSTSSMRVGITGIEGLLGWHLRCYLKLYPDVMVCGANRGTFQDAGKLSAFVENCDAIVHFAGMNRGEESLIERTNVSLMKSLLDACNRKSGSPHIVFASSSHIDRDTAYARSKRVAGELLMEWAERAGAKASILVLPNVFGEGGKPFYNSVVSTFAYQIAKGATPKIEIDREMELLHAQDVADLAFNVIKNRESGEIRPKGSKITVTDLLIKLKLFSDEYTNNRLPNMPSPLDIALFNTLRYYLFPDSYPRRLELRSDSRGYLYEAVKSRGGGGQTFLSTTHPGVTRGNHFHYRNIERFLVVSGQAVIKIRKLFSNEVASFRVSGDEPAYVDMPTLHTHSITNIGNSDLITLFWSNSIFDPAKPDTVKEQV